VELDTLDTLVEFLNYRPREAQVIGAHISERTEVAREAIPEILAQRS
jgi:hypothetical protein